MGWITFFYHNQNEVLWTIKSCKLSHKEHVFKTFCRINAMLTFIAYKIMVIRHFKEFIINDFFLSIKIQDKLTLQSSHVCYYCLKCSKKWKQNKRWIIFHQKMLRIKRFNSKQQTKNLMAFFNKKTLNNATLKWAWEHLEPQCSLWVKVNFDPTNKWKELNKMNIHKINLHFFNNHRFSCLWFMKHYQTKEKWKNNAMFNY
jgi:hypothetical protein